MVILTLLIEIKPNFAGDSRNFSFRKSDDGYLFADDYYQVALVIVQVYDYSLFDKIRNLNSELQENKIKRGIFKEKQIQKDKFTQEIEKLIKESTRIPVIKTKSNVLPVRGLLKRILSIWLNKNYFL